MDQPRPSTRRERFLQNVRLNGERSYMGAVETMTEWIYGEPVWPYARIIETWGEQFEMYRLRWSREVKHAVETGQLTSRDRDPKEYMRDTMAMWHLRDEWVLRFGFAIPCGELIDELKRFAPIVEVGAGTGYMTRLMRNAGIDVIGSDYDFKGYNTHGFMTGCFDDDQINGVQAKTMVRRYPRTVFCSWPTLDHTWFRQMLRAMRIGEVLIVIHEDACAEETAWQYLSECFAGIYDIAIPAFEHMNDTASVYVKKRHRAKV